MREIARTIVSWEWLILLLIMPLLLFPTGWLGLLLLVVPLLWLLRRMVTGRFFPATADDVAITFLLLALLVSLTAVFDIEYSFPKIAGLILGVALFYAAVQHSRDLAFGRYTILALILAAGCGMVFAALVANLGSSSFAFLDAFVAFLPVSPQALPGIGGLSVNPNELAGVLCWLVPLLTACTIGFWKVDRGRRTWWYYPLLFILIALLVLSCLILLATRSRGGLLSVSFAFLVMLAMSYRWGKWLILAAAAAAAGLLLLFLFTDIRSALPVSLGRLDEFGIVGRMEIWSRAVFALQDFPITGMGMNGFRVLVHILYPMFTIPSQVDLGHAHNQLLQAGLDLGIPGLAAYLALWILSGGLLWSAWRRSRNYADRVLILGLSGSLVAGWMFGLVDAIALGAKPGFIWWLLLALLVAVWDDVGLCDPV